MLNPLTFLQNLKKICSDYDNHKFLLAISGGVDSMVLLHLYKDLNIEFEVAHINYQLRGNDSDADQLLVKEFCKKNKIDFHLYEVSAEEEHPENSIQEWARNLRYDFFRKIQKEKKIDFVVTAHHLNDQLETFLINLSKASGIKGLSGIPVNENQVLRPLLIFSKVEIYDFAKENNIEFREDLSNQKNDYLRNKIRNEVVPKLEEFNDNFLENFGKSLSYLKETRDFAREQILNIEKEIVLKSDSFHQIDKKMFWKQSSFVQFEILRKFGFNSREEIEKISKSETGKKFISNLYELTIDREILMIKKLFETENVADHEIILKINSENEIIIPKRIRTDWIELGSVDWKLDLKKIRFPIILRQKKEGDIFHPIGMIGKKKVAKFFKDEKIPIFAQQNIWLLCDANDHILGILPFRQDRRFAATVQSKDIIKLKIEQSPIAKK